MTQNNLKEYRDQFTAEMWRSGKRMSGETFHAWLEEMVEKWGGDYATIHRFFQEIKQTHCKENNLNPRTLSNNEYVTITKRIEDAFVKVAEYDRERDKKTIKKTIGKKIKRIIRWLIGNE